MQLHQPGSRSSVSTIQPAALGEGRQRIRHDAPQYRDRAWPWLGAYCPVGFPSHERLAS
jgi:hypothetical protein